jgi:DNA-binding FrmR family transcriptional regulator
MKFDELYQLALEAKGTKPGERFFRASENEGPSGIASSPIGKSNYNPEIFKKERKDPNDAGMTDQIAITKLLGKAFQLLKNDDVFADQMKGIMNGFKKNRQQISAYQESIIKNKPKHIDNLWGRINRLITIVNDPKKRQDSDISKFEGELQSLKQQKDEEQANLDDVFKQIENVAGENEEINDSYLEQMLAVIRDTAKRLYKKQSAELLAGPEESQPRIIPLHELDIEMLQKEVEKDAQTQLKLLEMLFSEDVKLNPLLLFLDLQKTRYSESKQNFFNVNRGDNYSIAIEQLYKSLPLFNLINYFYNVIMKSPAITLNTKQKKRTNIIGSGDNMMQRLEGIKNEREWDEIRPDLIKYIKKQKIDKDRKKMLVDLAKGPFQAIRGRASAAIKIITSLKADSIKESFDQLAASYASSFDIDMNDFLIDLQEVKSLISRRKK